MADRLDNLSIASANHLHSQGHITLGKRNAIHEAVRRRPPKMRAPKFGALAQAPQQAQGPIPAVGMPGPVPGSTAGNPGGQDDGA
jgi:hypothetical protein